MFSCFSLKTLYAENENIIPKSDIGAHSEKINSILPMKDGRRLITASDDKTIRIWDTVSGTEQQKILGFIGAGSEGKINSIALTPNELYLAVGGNLTIGNISVIRIYDIITGQIVSILKSHTGEILDLSISLDGRYLVSASVDKSIKIWDIKNDFKLIHTLELHSSRVSSVRIFKNDGDYNIISAGDDGQVFLWSLLKKSIIEQQKFDFKLYAIAQSDKYIAVAGKSNFIYIFDRHLKQITKISSSSFETNVISSTQKLAFSPDSRLLAAGGNDRANGCTLFDISDINNIKRSGGALWQDVTAVAFIDNSWVVSSGEHFADIYIWNSNTGKPKITDGSLNTLPNNRRERFLKGIDGKNIIFSMEQLRVEFHSFTLDNFEINPYKTEGITYKEKGNLEYETVVPYKTISTKHGAYSLETPFSWNNINKENAALILKENDKTIITLGNDSNRETEYKNFGFTDDGTIITGGQGGRLEAFSITGKKLSSFKGHTGYISSIIIDGDKLISSSADQIIKVWNLNELVEGKKEIYPMVSIYISKDNEWIMWNEYGFYNSSAKGDNFIGWHINNEPEKSAEYYTAKQFRRYLHRPDIIKKTLELGSGEKAVKYMIKTEPGFEKIGIAELIKRAPLDVKIESLEIAKDGFGDLKIRLGQNKTKKLERITIYVDGFQVLTEEKRKVKESKPGDLLLYRFKLSGLIHKIKVTAENQWGESSTYKEILITDKKSLENLNYSSESTDARLYIVAIGIRNYPNLPPEQQLNSPPIDAKSISEAFKKLQPALYKDVDVLLLTDDDGKRITSDMVENAILEQGRKAGPLDTTIIFLAGHGVTDLKGDYHFVTADTKIKNAFGMQGGLSDNTSYSWNRLHKALDATMGRRIVLVDTCQAGEVISKTNTDITKLVKSVHDVNAIIYTGTSRQDSGMETKEGGVFTLSLISGINGSARYKNNRLSFKNLKEFVDKDVPARNEKIKKRQIERAIKLEIIDGKNIDAGDTQKPVSIIPDGMDGFTIFYKP